MKKIKLVLFPLVLLFSFVLLGSVVQVKAERKTVDVEIVTYFDETNQVPVKATGKAYGTKFKFNGNLGDTSGYEFSFWIVNGKVRKDLALDSDFVVTDNMSLKGVFKPTGKHAVVFMDANGDVLKVQHLAPGESASDAGITTLPDKPGYEVVVGKWDKSLSSVEGDTVYTLQYQRKTDDVAPILTVVNGTVNGETEDIFDFNEVVTVVANAPAEGKFFSHWQNGENIVSRQSTYTFTMLQDTTISAVYADIAPADQPLVTLSNKLALRDGYNSYMGQFYVPAGYTLVEYGMLTSSEAGQLVVDTVGVRKNLGKKYFEQSNEWLMSFPELGSANARAYLVCEDSVGELVTVYNEVIDEYNVTFNTNGGNTIADQVVVEGNKVKKPADPSKSESEFAGWFTDDVLTASFDFNTIITGDITLYAKWNAIVVEPTILYQTGFETGHGFKASTQYNNQSIANHGDSNNLWGILSGSPTATAPMVGSQQIQMRYYTATPGTINYARTMFSLSNVTKIEFMAKGTSGNNVVVAYSHDGNTWTDVETIALTTTGKSYTCNINATGAIYLKLQIVLPAVPVNKSDLLIDEVKIWGRA